MLSLRAILRKSHLFQLVKRFINEKLQNRGILIRRVNYRVNVPTDSFLLQQLLLKRLAVHSPTIVDAGANRGKIAARYRQLFPQADIYCVEPFPEMIQFLQNRFAGDDRTHLIPCALSDTIGTAEFHLTGLDTTNSLQPRKSGARRYFDKRVAATGQSIQVQTTTLDQICLDFGIQEVDILKFDIQGGELNALKGAANLLENHKVKLIYTESALIQHYEGEALLYEVTSFLAQYDYSLYNLTDLYQARNGQLRYCMATFVSPEMRHSALDTFPNEP